MRQLLPLSVALGLFFALPAAAQDWTIDPETNVFTLDEGETWTETITVTIPEGAVVPAVDVYMLADTTGSMSSPIAALRTHAEAIVDDLNTALAVDGVDLWMGIGNYKDFPSDSYAFQHQYSPADVDTDAVAIKGEIDLWSASGGSDGSEGQFFALDQLAEDNDPAGGTIGWRPDAKKVVLWFGDAPGHDAICSAISGLSYDIDEASLTAKLVAEEITVIAMGTTSGFADALDDDPTTSAYNYTGTCTVGGSSGQATRIATATGGSYSADVEASDIVAEIQAAIADIVGVLNAVTLEANGDSAAYVTDITDTTTDGCVDIDTSSESTCTWDVTWEGACMDDETLLEGTIDAVADGSTAVSKTVELTLPACNEAPVAVCEDVEISADDSCEGCESIDGGSYDPDGDDVTIVEFPECNYDLGTTEVTLEITDEHGATDSCIGSVTVVDDSPPVIDCGQPDTFNPRDAPAEFVVSADDNCGASAWISDYDCGSYNGAGVWKSKLESCVVSFDGDTLYIDDSGGVGDNIFWTVEACDDAGNCISQECSIEVTSPRRGLR